MMNRSCPLVAHPIRRPANRRRPRRPADRRDDLLPAQHGRGAGRPRRCPSPSKQQHPHYPVDLLLLERDVVVDSSLRAVDLAPYMAPDNVSSRSPEVWVTTDQPISGAIV
jgi:hypothetical protein